MKNISKILLITLALIIGFNSVALAGSPTTHGYFWKPGYSEHGPAAYSLYNAALDATDAIIHSVYTSISALNTLVTNWAPTENQDILVPGCTYASGTNFSVAGDFTAQFAANAKVRVDLGSGTLKGSYVASSSYGGGVTTVVLHDSILTNPLSGIWVTATRAGLFPYGPGSVVARDYGTPGQTALDDALAAVGVLDRTLVLSPGTWSITANTTIPANITLLVNHGVILSIATTKTLTINGQLVADSYQIFSCTGTGKVVFGRNKVTEIIPQWWGATGDGSTDDTTAIQACLTCGEQSTLPVFIPPGTYSVGPLKVGDTATAPVGTAQGPGVARLRGSGRGYAVTILKARAGHYGSNQYVLQRNNLAGIHYSGFQIDGNSIAKGMDLSWNTAGPSNQNILEDILIENCLNLGANLDNFMDSKTYGLQIRQTIGTTPVDLSHQSSGGSWEMGSCYFTGLIQLQSQNATLVNCGVYGGIELTGASSGQICMVGGQLYKNDITNICVNSNGTGDTSQGMTFVNVQFNDGTIFSGSYFSGARLIGCNIGVTAAGAFAADITPLGGAGNLPVFKLEHCIINPAQTFDTALASYVLDNCRGTAGAVRTPGNYVIGDAFLQSPNAFAVLGRSGETRPLGNGFALGSAAYATGLQTPAALGTVLVSPAADAWIDIGVGAGGGGSVTGSWIVTIASTYDKVSAIYTCVKNGSSAGVCTKLAGQNDTSLSMQWTTGTAQPQIKFATTAPAEVYIGVFGSGSVN